MSFRRCIAISVFCFANMCFFSGCVDSPSDPDAGRPEITGNPQNEEINFGDSILFSVAASGDMPMTYQWYKSGAEIDGATDSVLLLRNVMLSDTGGYYVVVRNSRGEATSDTTFLSVSGGEPVIGKQSVSDTVAIGDSVSLFVQVAGNPPFSYVWFKDDSLIEDADDSFLTVSSVSKEDLGAYRVIVANRIGSDTSAPMLFAIAPGILYISQSDYQSGLLEWMSTAGDAVSSSNLSIYSDAALRSFDGYLYIVERFGADNITKFDPLKSDRSGVMYQKHLGDNWNPQDIEFLSGTKAYISNMNEPEITIFDPSDGEITGNIDISAYTFMPDSNASPYANDLQLVGSNLYVMLQRRNGFKPGAPTLILVINTANDEVTDSIPLQFKNGYAMAYADGALYVSNPGSAYATGDGAIEKVELSNTTVSTVIEESTLGGSPNEIVHKNGTRFYVTSYIGWKNVKVLEIDAAAQTVVSTLPDVKDAFGGIRYDEFDNILYVGERDSLEMGVRIYRNNEQVGSPVRSSNSLPPTGMIVVRR